MTTRTIHKYELEIADETEMIEIPVGFKFLGAQMQHGKLCVWVVIDSPAKFTCPITFRVIGTGHPIEDANQLGYVGMVQDRDFVWHVFWKCVV